MMRRDDSSVEPAHRTCEASGGPDGTRCARGERLPEGFAESLASIVASGGAGRGVTALCEARLFELAVDLLFRANRIVIVTGFFIPSCMAPETDGPGGSAVLGRALLRLGKDVRLATDSSCFDAVAACSRRIGGPSVLRADSPEALVSESFDLLVYVERVGRASDGRYYNMRCEDVSSWVVPLDDAASAALGSGIPVLAVGDGGNEAGMGFFADRLAALIPSFSPCCSAVSATCALPVDVSTWGAYALAAGVSGRAGRRLGHSEAEEMALLETMRDMGVVDGVTRRPGLSVDGFPPEETMRVVRALFSLCEKSCLRRD